MKNICCFALACLMLAAASESPGQPYNRGVIRGSISFVPAGDVSAKHPGGDAQLYRVTFDAFVANETGGPLDMSTEMTVAVNGVAAGTHTVAVTAGDDNDCTCGSTCPGENELCIDDRHWGGTGCYCSELLPPPDGIYVALSPGDTVTASVAAVPGSAEEYYTADDTESTLFQPPSAIPSLTTWGLIALASLLLLAGTSRIRTRQRV